MQGRTTDYSPTRKRHDGSASPAGASFQFVEQAPAPSPRDRLSSRRRRSLLRWRRDNTARRRPNRLRIAPAVRRRGRSWGAPRTDRTSQSRDRGRGKVRHWRTLRTAPRLSRPHPECRSSGSPGKSCESRAIDVAGAIANLRGAVRDRSLPVRPASLQPKRVELVDGESSDATLRASRLADQPLAAAAGRIGQGRIDNLHQLLIARWKRDAHGKSIAQARGSATA